MRRKIIACWLAACLAIGLAGCGQGNADGQKSSGGSENSVVEESSGKEVEMTVKPGQRVITSKYSGTEIKLDGEEYIVVRQSDILAIVED